MHIDALLPRLYAAVTHELKIRQLERACIPAAGIVLRVLHALGYAEAYPLTVTAILSNEAYEKWEAEHGDPMGDPEAMTACRASGGMVVFVGRGPLENIEGSWMGHVVVVIPNSHPPKHALLDLTITQANHPEHRIALPPLLMRVRDEFVDGKEPFGSTLNMATIIYTAFPDDHSYRETPAWQNTEGVE